MPHVFEWLFPHRLPGCIKTGYRLGGWCIHVCFLAFLFWRFHVKHNVSRSVFRTRETSVSHHGTLAVTFDGGSSSPTGIPLSIQDQILRRTSNNGGTLLLTGVRITLLNQSCERFLDSGVDPIIPKRKMGKSGAWAVNNAPYDGIIRTQCPRSASFESTSVWSRGSLRARHCKYITAASLQASAVTIVMES
jgi:hypothetical protein